MPTLQLPIQHLQARALPQTIDLDRRTVEIVWSTGATVARVRWRGWDAEPYNEQLSLDPQHVRLERLNNGAPVLVDHRSWDSKAQVGVIERAWIAGGEGRALIRMGRGEEAEVYWQDLRDGIRTKFSVGYRTHAVEDVSKKDDKLRTLRAVDWEPYEVSFVSVPADDGAGVRGEHRHQTFPCAVRGQTMDDDLEFGAGVQTDTRSGAQAPPPQTPPPAQDQGRAQAPPQAAPRPAQPPVDLDRVRREAAEAERERVRAITAECRRLNLGDELVERLVTSGRSLNDCRADIIDAVAERSQDPPAAPRFEPGIDERDKVRSAVVDALLHRLDPANHQLTDGARDFVGVSLMELNRSLLERQGIRTKGWSRSQLAQRALHSTSDFPAVLENIANKRLRRAYEIAGRTWGPLGAQANLPDFKEISRVQLGEAPVMEKVPEGGEIKRGTIGEGKETWGLATYAKIVAFTRQAVVNDDLMAFDRTVREQGRQCRVLEDNVVWALVTTPHVLADGQNIFHTSRANTGTGAITVANVGKGREKMAQQKGLDGKTPLNIQPEVLIVPSALQTVAQQFARVLTVPDSDGNANPFKGNLAVISEPRLDAASTTQWYLGASPGQVDMIEWGYLEGEQGPQFATKEGWDVDGVEFKCRLDFGATVLDYRGFYRSSGS